MYFCPNCATKLIRGTIPSGVVWECPACKGRSGTVGLLRKSVPAGALDQMWQNVLSGKWPQKRRCPACGKLMTEVPCQGRLKTQYLDVCPSCYCIWFDSQEIESMPAISHASAGSATCSDAQEQALAIESLREKKKDAEEEDGRCPDELWKTAAGILGFPVEYDSRLQTAPLLTWFLAAFIIFLNTIGISDLPQAINDFGLIPAQFGRMAGLTLVSSFFLHGGIAHWLGNMYFLLIFGDNVEEVLGRAKYAFLIIFASLCGDLAHILSDPASTMPCVGASGGISGVICYYALRFPEARIGILFMRYRWVNWPAYAVFLCWLALQVFGTFLQVAAFSNVSAMAHLGGAGAGIIMWQITKKTTAASPHSGYSSSSSLQAD